MVTLAIDLTRRSGPITVAQKHWQSSLRIALTIVVFTSGLVFTTYILLRCWQGMDWWQFWFILLFLAVITLLLFNPLAPLKTRNEVALRRFSDDLLTLDDPLIAPIAQKQPDPLPLALHETFVIGNVRSLSIATSVMPFNFLERSLRPGNFTLRLISAIVAFMLVIVLLLVAYDKAFGLSARLGGAYLWVPILTPALCLMLAFAQLSLFFFRLNPRHFSLMHADADGLHWQNQRKTITVPWQSMRFFAMMRGKRPNQTDDAITGYILIADDYYYVWAVRADAPLEERLMVKDLASLIVSQTQVSLRDMTQLCKDLQTGNMDLRRVLAKYKAAGTDVATLESLIEKWYATTPRAMRLRYVRVALSCALLLPVLLLGVIGQRAEAAQASYFAYLPVPLQSQKPLYHVAFTKPDAAWPTHTPVAHDVFGATFTNEGYQLHGNAPAHYLVVLGPGTYGDAAIAVNVHPGQGVDNQINAGIVVRASADGSTALVFSLQDFFEYAQHCDLQLTSLDGGCHTLYYVANVKQETDFLNGSYSLLVIMHGDSLLFYVNGTLYCTYNDAAGLVPHAGKVGLYSFDSTQTVIFSDFTIYPAGGATPWDYLAPRR